MPPPRNKPRRRLLEEAKRLVSQREGDSAEKRGRVRRLVRVYEGVQKIKLEHEGVSITTPNADAIRSERAYRRSALRALNRAAQKNGIAPSFTEHDVEQVLELGVRAQAMIDFSPALRRVKPNYPMHETILDYVKARNFLQEHQIPATPSTLLAAMLQPRFKGHEAKVEKALKEFDGQGDQTPATPRRLEGFNQLDFFKRIMNDKRELSRVGNQQIVLESQLEKFLTKRSRLHTMVRTAEKEVDQPLPHTLKDIRARVREFDGKPQVIRERIVQEHVARRLGMELAREITTTLNLQSRSSQTPTRRTMFAWMIESLQNKENVRFLARKALGWYRLQL